MVRRKVRDAAVDLPSWVLTYVETAWAASGGFNAWRQAVRDWCKANDLSRADPSTWMMIVRNYVGVNHERSWSDSRPDISSAIQTVSDLSQESEAL